MQKIKMK